MIHVFQQLLSICCEDVGPVQGVHYYSEEFMTIEGRTTDGKKFSITLSVKEEKENGN